MRRAFLLLESDEGQAAASRFITRSIKALI